MSPGTAGDALRLAIDPWAADYDGGAGRLDLDEPTASVDADVETRTWQAIRPAARLGAPPELCFVDGVRRIELRFVAEIGTRRARGLFGSYAVGAAHAGTAATIGKEHIGRLAAFHAVGGTSLPPIELVLGDSRLRFEPEGTTDDSPDAPLRALQNAMRRAEAAIAATLAGSVAAVFVDGPLAASMPPGPFVGYVKRLLRSYLGEQEAALLPKLRAGERTPMFLLHGAPLDRYSWYQRIGSGRAIDTLLHGVVRCECAASLGLAAARELADLAARELVRFASDPLRDPRAPQNLFPIGALETHLRHRLGDPLLLRRALELHVATRR